MKILPIFLILFGIVIILYPQFLAYLLGGFFIFIGINMLVIGGFLKMFKKTSGQGDYVQFGKYKIYK